MKLFIPIIIIFYSFFIHANQTNLIDTIKNQTASNEKIVGAIQSGMVDIFVEDSIGNTPLHWAYQTNNKEVIDALLEAGAEENVKNARGRTPKEMAKPVKPYSILPPKKQLVPSISKSPLPITLTDSIKANNLNEVLRYLANNRLDQSSLNLALYTTVEQETVNQKIVSTLLATGADPNAKSGYTSALFRAAQNNDIQTVSNLLSTNKVNVDTMSEPFNVAIKNNNIKIMSLLLQAGADPNNGGEYSEKHLITAIRNKNLDAILLLASAGADPKQKTDNGYTAIDVAVEKMNLDATSKLVSIGVYPIHGYSFILATQTALANTDNIKRDRDIETIIQMFNIIYENQLPKYRHITSIPTNKIDKVVSLVSIAQEQSKESTIVSIGYNNKDTCRILLTHVHDVDAVSLWWIAASQPTRSKNILDVLLNMQMISDANIKNKNGNTALHEILTRNPKYILTTLEALLKSGANPNMKNHEEKKPLDLIKVHMSGSDIRYKARTILVKYGAIPDEWSSFWSKTRLNHVENVQSVISLFEQAGNINARDHRGRTMLHEIVKIKHSKLHSVIIPELIQRGIDPSIKDNNGKTALDIAASKYGSSRAKKLLESLTVTTSCQRTMAN